jgi:nucleotide-binding universal stress UspA family protein
MAMYNDQLFTTDDPLTGLAYHFPLPAAHTFRGVPTPPAANSAAVSQTKPTTEATPADYLMRLLVATPAGFRAADTWTYARQVASLVGGKLNQFRMEKASRSAVHELTAEAARGYGLLVMGEPDESSLTRLMRGPIACKVAADAPISLLVARQPRWPLRHILLVIRNIASDDCALRWVMRLAQRDKTKVTLLVLNPPGVLIDSRELRMQRLLTALFANESNLPPAVYKAADYLQRWGVAGRLHMGSEPDDIALERELQSNNYDLTVIAAEPRGWWRRRFWGDVIAPLLYLSQQPVLIARPLTEA